MKKYFFAFLPVAQFGSQCAIYVKFATNYSLRKICFKSFATYSKPKIICSVQFVAYSQPQTFCHLQFSLLLFYDNQTCLTSLTIQQTISTPTISITHSKATYRQVLLNSPTREDTMQLRPQLPLREQSENDRLSDYGVHCAFAVNLAVDAK